MLSNKEKIKTVKIIPPEGWEVDEEKSTFGEFVYKEIPKKPKLPTSWEELCYISGYIANNSSVVSKCNDFIAVTGNKDIFAFKEEAEASIAMAQLSQLRKVYRDGWIPNWKDEAIKFGISFVSDILVSDINSNTSEFLSFQSGEVRDEFLKNFRELIMQAKPLLA